LAMANSPTKYYFITLLFENILWLFVGSST
jgi:hypothetical protein